MIKNDYHLFGEIYKKHGYKGHLNLYSEKTLLDIDLVKFLYIEEDGELIPFFVEEIRKKKENIYLIKFEDVNSDCKADLLLNKIIFIERKLINAREEEDINNFSVIDINMGKLGIVEDVDYLSHQKLIKVKGQKSFMIPFHEEFVKNINKKEKVIQVKIPEELIKINN